MVTLGEVCLIILAVIFPPLAVLFSNGCGCHLLLNILLTICGFIPGVVHAFYVLAKDSEDDNRRNNRMDWSVLELTREFRYELWKLKMYGWSENYIFLRNAALVNKEVMKTSQPKRCDVE